MPIRKPLLIVDDIEDQKYFPKISLIKSYLFIGTFIGTCFALFMTASMTPTSEGSQGRLQNTNMMVRGWSWATYNPVNESLETANNHTTNDHDFDCVERTEPVMGGYDIVAYWSLPNGANGTKGLKEFSASYNDYEFRFSTWENQQKFLINPSKYLPQWGGYCAHGIAQGNSQDLNMMPLVGPAGNPDVWMVINDKLYFYEYLLPWSLFTKTKNDTSSSIDRGNLRWKNYTNGNAEWYANTRCLHYSRYCGHDRLSCLDLEQRLQLDELFSSVR